MDLGLSVQLSESLGNEGVDLVRPEAEVGCLGDELVNGGAHLLAAGVHPEDGRSRGDIGADPAASLDEAVPLKELVNLGHGERVHVELC